MGLTGPNASGKGEVASFLAASGFDVHSLSDAVREEATRRGLDHSRDHLIRVGVDLRSEHGPGALALSVLPRLKWRAVVDSIRNPGEVEVLRRLPHFLLLGIDAPQALPAGQQLLATLALADVLIDNDGTIADLRRKVQRALRAHGLETAPL